MNATKILVFQEYQGLNLLIENILREDGYEHIYTISDPESVVAAYNDLKPDVFLCEIELHHQFENFIDLILSTERTALMSKLICIISKNNQLMKVSTERLGVKRYLEKPFFIEEVKIMVDDCL
ncbi:response regulator [Halalkalibacter alkalisediminis]|uniref:Response regulator n=1 Tax=Halalkalibacter alkalisediminis TaxID=935616 RepID=A0ABV6NIR7_9BACI|nr:response regulator [Halalkalibacter alkalisediminis]